MAGKEQVNKTLTVKQRMNRARGLQYTLFGSEFLSALAPYIAMGIANYDEWFIQNEEGWKIGLGGALALAILGMAVFLVGKRKEDEKITGGYISLILGWFAVAFVFMLLANIMDQISTIMLFGGLGLIGSFGLDIGSKRYKAEADRLKAAIEEASKQLTTEQAKLEINKEAEKKRVF